MRSYLLKAKLQMQSAGISFYIFCEVIINCHPSFITCLYFLLASIRSHSGHQQLMELFKSKESFKKILIKGKLKNCMAKHDFRVNSSPAHLFAIRRRRNCSGDEVVFIVTSIFNILWENIQIFTQKMSVHFLYFLFK